MSLPVPKPAFSVNGTPDYWERKADDGSSVQCAFCNNCGTRLFHLPERNRKIVNVKPGTLDNAQWLNPVGHLWVHRVQAGVSLPNDRLLYQGQPDNFDALFEAWLDNYEVIDA